MANNSGTGAALFARYVSASGFGLEQRGGWQRRRMLFSGVRPVSERKGDRLPSGGRPAREQSGRIGTDDAGAVSGAQRGKTGACLPSVSDPGLGGSSSGWLKASYTVEASLVMSAAFFLIAALLTGVFQVHARVAGRFVLQEALERGIFLEAEEKKEAEIRQELEQEAENRLRSFFWCGDGRLELEWEGNVIRGQVTAGSETQIEVTGYDPENRIRLLTAGGI